MTDFDRRAQDFDTDRRKDRARVIADAIRALINQEHHSAMEFGCGTGLVGLELIDHFCEMTFIDNSQGMIEKVREKIENMPKASALQCDLLADSCRGARYDFIFTSMVLHHIADLSGILAALFRVLSPGGRLVIVDLNSEDGRFHANDPDFDGHHGFDQAELRRLLSDVGYREVESSTFYEGVKDDVPEPISYSLFILKADKKA